MCGPTAILVAGLVISAAATGYSYYVQEKATDEHNRYVSRQQKEGKEAAEEAFRLGQQDLDAQAEEDAAATRDNLFQRRVEFLEARSRGNVAAGEAGVGGRSIQALFNNFQQQQDRATSNIQTNFGFRHDQRLRQLRGLDAQRRGRHSQANALRFSDKPSKVALGINLGSGAINSFNQYNSLTV